MKPQPVPVRVVPKKVVREDSAWDRVKQALQRDWAQTKTDLTDDGKDLRQEATDTVAQAVGTQVIPPPGQPNPAHKRDWAKAEAAVRYGFAARSQYGADHDSWSDELDGILAKSWNERVTGERYEDIRSEVQLGWHAHR